MDIYNIHNPAKCGRIPVGQIDYAESNKYFKESSE